MESVFSSVTVGAPASECLTSGLHAVLIMKDTVLWYVTPCSLVEAYDPFFLIFRVEYYPEDGGSRCLRNVCKSLPGYMALYVARVNSRLS